MMALSAVKTLTRSTAVKIASAPPGSLDTAVEEPPAASLGVDDLPLSADRLNRAACAFF